MVKKSKAPDGPFAGLRELRDKLVEEEKKKKEAPKTASGKRPSAAGARPAAPSKPRTPAAKAASELARSEEDALAFHRLVSGVTPLDQTRGRVARAQHGRDENPDARAQRESAQARVQQESDEVHEHLRVLVEGGSRFEVSDDGRHVEGRRVDVPSDWLRRVRRGLVPIDGTIDLHGQRAGEARDTLETFLHTMRERGERCVLVVHGKGEHSPGGLGVLRGEIAAWLSQGTSSTHVAAFASAREEDGGAGAVYVLLRR
ncbi:Smr/MutS family protein [Pendulispora albinea]|uniref:Smr/MutS family protein n=1 Tax=Pendulispora albinea TaxID=2741071 RepID=A0ABZ2LRZ7_9BACT